MGAYTWLSDQEFERYSQVEDQIVNEAFQEVRALMPNWFIEEKQWVKKSFFGKSTAGYTYTVYQREKEDCSDVRIQMSASSPATVCNLLYGLYMGYKTRKHDSSFDLLHKVYEELKENNNKLELENTNLKGELLKALKK